MMSEATTEFLRAWYRRVAPMSDCESREQAALIDFALAAHDALTQVIEQMEGAPIPVEVDDAIALYAKVAPTEGESDG